MLRKENKDNDVKRKGEIFYQKKGKFMSFSYLKNNSRNNTIFKSIF